MHGYTEGSAIKLYARESSEVSFVMAAMDNDTTTADTLYRIDMAMAAEADLVVPQFLFELPGITNYYYPHTAPDGVTGVTAYKRVVYQGIYPNIDFHLYSGSSGPRMCWVVWPGGDVADIYLHFAGHDSLRVDWGLVAVTSWCGQGRGSSGTCRTQGRELGVCPYWTR